MKRCIWCLKTDKDVSFEKDAHTIPQNLGGKNICLNVCDKCNQYFGNYDNKLPPIETVLKEAFNLSRARFLQTDNEIGKNKAMPRFSSIYFNLDLNKNKFSLKAAYKFSPNFQLNITRQLKRGIYKIFLEETERKLFTAHDKKYDFIREFSRYNIGDYPLLYFERTHGIIMLSREWPKSPELLLEEEKPFTYLIHQHGFFEFEFLGHVFGIAIEKDWEKDFKNYMEKTKAAKKEFFKSVRVINNLHDIDLTLSILND